MVGDEHEININLELAEIAPKSTDVKAQSGSNGNGRSSVVPLNYTDKDSLQKAYMPFSKGGGLFFPTSAIFHLNEELFLLVTLPESSKAFTVPGTVIWITPASSMDGGIQGVGIEFRGREGNALRNRIEGFLGVKVSSPDPNYTM